MKRRVSTWRAIVRSLCVLALVAVSFAHRAPALAATSPTPSEIAAMVLPDGTLPDLCLTDDDAGGGKSGHLGGPICDACLISAAMLLPAPIDLTGTALPVVLKAEIPRRHEAFRRQIYPPNAAPRAPPVPVLA